MCGYLGKPKENNSPKGHVKEDPYMTTDYIQVNEAIYTDMVGM